MTKNKREQKQMKMLLKSPNLEGIPSYSLFGKDFGKEQGFVYQGDCLQIMNDSSLIVPGSVDMVLVDLPYGTTQNKWDIIIPFDKLWKCFHLVAKPDAVFVFTATQPFTSHLVLSNIDEFKYDMIWEKTISSGQLNVKHQPLRKHESILVFYGGKHTYNEQLQDGKPYKINRRITFDGPGYGKQKASSKENTGYRHPTTVIKVSNPRKKGGHPTEKPVELMEYLIKTYSNIGDTVLDCCCGSGTTLVAAQNLGRRFIGIELNEKYYLKTQERLENEK